MNPLTCYILSVVKFRETETRMVVTKGSCLMVMKMLWRLVVQQREYAEQY